MAYSPIFPFTGQVTSSYTGGVIYMAIRGVVSASYEQSNLGNPIALFAIDPTLVPAMTGTLSASYSRSLG